MKAILTLLTNTIHKSVHKRRPQSVEEGGFVQCRHFTDKGDGSSDADVRTF